MGNSEKTIFKSAGLMSFATFSSRILGFVRDILMAYFFGTAMAAQAFVVAFRIPNMLRDLVAEGAANAAVVPVLSDNLVKRKRSEFWELIQRLFWVTLSILSVITLVGIFASGLIVRLIAPGFIEDFSKLKLTVTLTRILFPHILIMGLAAFSMAVLFSLRSFKVPAFGSTIQNAVFIISILVCTRFMQEPIIGVALGVLLGGILQILVQVPVLKSRGFSFISVKALKEKVFCPEIKQIGRLLVPRIFGTAIYQANIFIDTCLASLAFIVGEGAVAAIYYANRLIQLPFAIFCVSLANASLPVMSAQVAREDFAGLKRTMTFSLKSLILLILPASVGLGILSREIITVLFQRGSFDAYSTQITALALGFYSLGLVFYSGTKILVNCFYAMKNTVTPVKVAGICLGVNLLFNLILMFPLKVAGLALASSISALVNFSLLVIILNKKLHIFSFADWKVFSLKALLCSCFMGYLLHFLKANFILNSNPIINLMLLIVISIIAFFASVLVARFEQGELIFSWIRSKLIRR